jgi:hypothetical protein
MKPLISVGGFVGPESDAVELQRSASRTTLRQVLLAELRKRVRFGKTFMRYETRGDRVVAYFEDASSSRQAHWPAWRRARPNSGDGLLGCRRGHRLLPGG